MTPVILSGGSGTRLWPLSRQNFPKQFCQLFTESLMNKSLRRVSSFNPPVIVTTQHLKGLTEKSLKDLNITEFTPLYEPFGKNTAPAIALLCQYFTQKNQTSEVVGIFPADQLVENTSVFEKAVQLGEQCAHQGQIVTLGICPTHPATGYGYIETTPNIISTDQDLKAFSVSEFHEKPGKETAEKYLENGSFFWNAGMFIFKIQTMVKLLQKHAPLLWEAIQQLKNDFSNIEDVYNSMENISIDYAIVEKLSSQELTCIPTDMGWDDVGSWDAMTNVSSKTNQAQIIETQAEDNYVFSQKNKIYAFNHASNLIVVDTDDALLVTCKGQSQNIKDIVKILDKQNDPRTQEHIFDHRPWGKYEILKDTKNFKSKVITVDPHSQISYQSHTQREEHWVITSGVGEVILNDETIAIKKGAYVHVPQGSKHRIRNTGTSPLQFVEVQLGSYFGEDDIIRYEDDYQRT